MARYQYTRPYRLALLAKWPNDVVEPHQALEECMASCRALFKHCPHIARGIIPRHSYLCLDINYIRKTQIIEFSFYVVGHEQKLNRSRWLWSMFSDLFSLRVRASSFRETTISRYSDSQRDIL